MKTASFQTYGRGPGRISIARSAPRWLPRGFKIYRDLAPGDWFHSVDWPEYCERYAAQLARLDPIKVCMDLQGLAGDAEPVLLCWEDLSDPEQRCHRTLVADWLKQSLDIDIEEMDTRQLVLV